MSKISPEKETLIQLIQETENIGFIQNLIRELREPKEPNIFEEINQLKEDKKLLEQKINKLTSAVSYELGSPLNSLKSMADLLMLDMDNLEDKMLVSTGQYLYAQIEALQARMQNLIAWSNLETENFVFNPKTLQAKSIIEKSFQSQIDLARKKSLQIQINCDEKQTIQADEAMLGIVLNNLISNAIKFCRKGDFVHISALPNGENQIQIMVKDKGIGMGRAKLKKVFDLGRTPQRGTANEQGLGLGLVTVRRLLELHETELKIESKRGGGASFSFLLPQK